MAEWGATDRRISGHSVRKSLVSALYGVAVGKGLVDVHRTLAELGVDDAKPPLSDQEKQARLVDLLTARSGIYHNSVKADFERDRPARHAHRPDTYFYYNKRSNAIFQSSDESLPRSSVGSCPLGQCAHTGSASGRRPTG